MDHETAGDPVRGLKWTRRTTAKVAAQLRKLGTDICARTVARLLKKMGFSLRVNHKKRAGASHPNRDVGELEQVIISEVPSTGLGRSG